MDQAPFLKWNVVVKRERPEVDRGDEPGSAPSAELWGTSLCAVYSISLVTVTA